MLIYGLPTRFNTDPYFPGWASIGGIIVGGENRDGSTNVKFHQEDTLRRIMDRVTSELGVGIERFRADCGSFSKRKSSKP